MASNKSPFLVHLIFHPASDKARGVALALHKALKFQLGAARPDGTDGAAGGGRKRAAAEAARSQPGRTQCRDRFGR